ncbi:MAG: sulfurtransferase complex subunit TusB [Caldisericia bacterium]
MYKPRKKMLIMLLKSPWACDLETLRVQNALPGDAVVLTQDSVLGVTNPPEKFKKIIEEKIGEGVRVFASKADCIARGITPIEGVTMIDYPEIVDIICECDLSY